MKVNLVGIGASRSGSTWLSACLAEHPEITFSEPKEVHYFDDEVGFAKGPDYYHSFFTPAPNQTYGEYTPGYFTTPLVAERLHDYNPDAKLIILLRNPIDRAYSEYLYNKGREFEDAATFSEALTGPRRERYLGRGHYAELLKPFFDRFPAEQIFLRRYEAIKTDPATVLQELYTFLAVDPAFTPSSLKQQINVSRGGASINHLPFLNNIIGKVLQSHKQVWWRPIKPVLRVIGAGNALRRIREKNINHNAKPPQSVTPMTEADKQTLLAYYQDKNQALTTLLQQDFSDWNQ